MRYALRLTALVLKVVSDFLSAGPSGWGMFLLISGVFRAPAGVASGGPTFSHLNALRAAGRREAYGLYAQKWAEKAPAPFGLDPRLCLIGQYQG